jgi:hypothetical protein
LLPARHERPWGQQTTTPSGLLIDDSQPTLGIRRVHCQLDKEQLEAALMVCLWTTRELMQGTSCAEFHGPVLTAESTDADIEFKIKHWEHVLEFEGDCEGILGRPWETGLLLKAVDRIIAPAGGSLNSRSEKDAQVISLSLPRRVASHQD